MPLVVIKLFERVSIVCFCLFTACFQGTRNSALDLIGGHGKKQMKGQNIQIDKRGVNVAG